MSVEGVSLFSRISPNNAYEAGKTTMAVYSLAIAALAVLGRKLVLELDACFATKVGLSGYKVFHNASDEDKQIADRIVYRHVPLIAKIACTCYVILSASAGNVPKSVAATIVGGTLYAHGWIV